MERNDFRSREQIFKSLFYNSLFRRRRLRISIRRLNWPMMSSSVSLKGPRGQPSQFLQWRRKRKAREITPSTSSSSSSEGEGDGGEGPSIRTGTGRILRNRVVQPLPAPTPKYIETSSSPEAGGSLTPQSESELPSDESDGLSSQSVVVITESGWSSDTEEQNDKDLQVQSDFEPELIDLVSSEEEEGDDDKVVVDNAVVPEIIADAELNATSGNGDKDADVDENVWFGFDMSPMLKNNAEDKRLWKQFLLAIGRRFDKDPSFVVLRTGIVLRKGWCPVLPIDGTKFLSFSTFPPVPFRHRSISVLQGENENEPSVRDYVKEIYKIAANVFGTRVYKWGQKDPGNTRWGLYTREEYNDIQLQALHACDEIIPLDIQHFNNSVRIE